MNSEDTRNMIMAIALSMAVIFAWQLFFAPPPPEPTTVQQTGSTATGGDPSVQLNLPDDQPALALDRDGALAQNERIKVENASVWGSISLKGGRLDDLHLSDYRETLDPGSDTVTLLNPTGGPHPYYATYGWLRTADGNTGKLPNPNTEWELESGTVLSPGSDITLKWENDTGLIFRRTYGIDDKYMFTVTQSLENTTGEPVTLAPYGYVARRDLPDLQQLWILHEGAVGKVDDELILHTYSSFEDLPANALEGGNAEAIAVQNNGWVGLTDKYWLTALIPTPGTSFDSVYKYIPGNTTRRVEYRAEMRLPLVTVDAGASASIETMYFAGAKEYVTLDEYETSKGIVDFHMAIDWGWFYFLTKPLFRLLLWVNGIIGNMGWAIIGLTFLVKAVLLPLAYKSYVAMSRMKQLQPEMEKIKERVGDDKQKMQVEMMELYKKEKVNPAAGCLPILLQIPIFFSLYKVFFVAIEMRHAPFIGWIKDLSAPDPSSWMNLFGALPYDVPEPGVGLLGLFSIGIYPILMGITMWMQQKLNPAPTDPTQAMVFAWMPWVFMFMLGTFSSGLVIYWVANNTITFIQQYAIMRSQGVNVDFFGNVAASFKKRKTADGGGKK
ncbi:MAG: membrane protein insertase YidC [Pseudomonadota bacterium]